MGSKQSQPKMTDATPEIRKLADTIVQRYLAHPDGSFYAELMAQIEPLIASAIAQVLQDERAKRGALIGDAIDAIEETMGHNRTNLSEHDGCLTCRIIERVRALDPEATQAFDALRAVKAIGKLSVLHSQLVYVESRQWLRRKYARLLQWASILISKELLRVAMAHARCCAKRQP